MVENDDVVTDLRVANADAPMDLAAAADDGASLERDARMNDRVGSDLDVPIDERRCRIFQRDTGGHERCRLGVANDTADLCQFGAAVDAANLVGICDTHGLDVVALRSVDADEIRQVIFILHVFRE